MMNMGMSLRAVVAVCLLAWTTAAVHAEDAKPTDPAGEAAQQDRVAQLEEELKAAKDELEKLKAELEAAKQELAAAAEKPAKPTAKPVAKKVDESAGYFPKGTKVSGTFTGASGPQAATGTVHSRTANGAVLRVTNLFGTFDWEVRIKGKNATLVGMRTVRSNNGLSAAFLDIKVGGTIDESSLNISGSWRVKGAGGAKTSNVSLELKPE